MATIKKAPPPYHSVIAVGTILALCLVFLPSTDSIDRVATLNTFTTPIFPNSVLSNTVILGCVRISFSLIVFFVSAQRWVYARDEIETTYLPKSKLKSCYLKFVGVRTQFSFTSWAWNLLGLSFFLNGLIPLLAERYGREDYYGDGQLSESSLWLRRIALLCFEIAAPAAVLTSAVVKYALWPKSLADKGPGGTLNFKSFAGQMQHNANSIMVLAEVLLLGGLPVKLDHIAVSPLLGISHVLFAWYMSNRWSPKHGPQFLYFFFDTTLGKTTTIALLALCAVLLVFYILFSVTADALEHMGGGWVTHGVAMVIMSSFLCRFRD